MTPPLNDAHENEDDDDCFCSDDPGEEAYMLEGTAAERPFLSVADVPAARTVAAMRTAGRWQQSMGFSLDLDYNVTIQTVITPST